MVVGPLFAVVAVLLLNPFEKSDTLGVVVVVVVAVAVNENGFSVDDELDKDIVSEFVIVDRGCCCVAVVVVELVCTGSGLKPPKPLNPANIDGFSESSVELDNDDVVVVVVVDEIGNGFKLANG